MVPLKIVSNVSRFKPALNLNWVLADLNRGSNSWSSISDSTKLRSNPSWGATLFRIFAKTFFNLEVFLWFDKVFILWFLHVVHVIKFFYHLQASAIVVLTTSGKTGHVISKYKPLCPILAVTRHDQVHTFIFLFFSMILFNLWKILIFLVNSEIKCIILVDYSAADPCSLIHKD